MIEVEGIGKRFQLGATYHNTLSDFLRHRVRGLLGTREGGAKKGTQHFWALKNVSFEVAEGEVVGIIGRNGAGKSTLLKILSRITPPTEGRIRLHGRVASLLEVGTGFHPELTGRENIFLNGAILGMTRSEINSKFDQIVAFAEVEKFLDTPVKRYSSGMHVRLAFAVAAHLEPEILIVDEVLAVGDAEFQKKSLGKMGEVAKGGRTVLFVSHNVAAIRKLCTRTVWLQGGKVKKEGDTTELTEAYLQHGLAARSADGISTAIRALPPDPVFQLDAIRLIQRGMPRFGVLNGEPVEIEVDYTVKAATRGLRVSIDIYDEEGTLLVRTFHDEHLDTIKEIKAGTYVSKARLPGNLLLPRTYEIVVSACIHSVRWCLPNGVRLPLSVEDSTGINRAYPNDTLRGKLKPFIPWVTSRKPQDDIEM